MAKFDRKRIYSTKILQNRFGYGIISVMELHEANRILRSVKAALYADGIKLPPSAETDGLMMLLGKLDVDKFLAPKIKRARTAAADSAAFNRAFYTIAFFRALIAVKNGISDPVTSVSVMFLHKNVCGDLDPNAGKPRTVEMTTDGGAHTDPKYIGGSLKSVITKMNEIASAPAISKEDFAGYLTHYMRELIIMHPFERGSDFTVRLFIMLFCKLKGFSVCFYRSPAKELKDAETDAFAADDITPLYKVLLTCLSYEHTVSSQPQKPSPQTRREISHCVRKIPPKQNSDDDMANIKQKALEQKNADNNIDDVLKRAIKLQQKITRLNEQLTDLINQSGQNKDNK